ncbi:unannotated protein [freshwater metagenome]|uniref:Unannotated protein n=1 Tax=freshwater metagenome TaxID=449393 RepID=A0A6J6FS44_9ZZZZ|nr:UPF0182 family protein [Actinomycetota bacterium]
MNRNRTPLVATLAILVAIGALFVAFSGYYIDWLWFQSVDFTSVWSKVLTTKIELFLIFGLATAFLITFNIFLAYKRRPFYVPTAIELNGVERLRAQIEPILRYVLIALFFAIAYFAGSSGSLFWSEYLLYKNSTPFGITDPQFNMDISFFVFKLPLIQALLGWAISALVLTAIATLFVHYMYGGIRPQAQSERTTVAARVQLSILFGAIVLVKAAAYWVDRYQLALKENKLITGATYSDVNALLPAKSILAGIALVCALLFFANIVRRSWLLPAAGTALMVISSLLIAGIYPAAVQQFQVKPSESSKEAPYIQRNIDATRTAYGLDGVVMQDYNATLTTTSGQLASDAATISNIRLMDPNVISSTFRQLQQIKPYYTFTESLDVDRYTVNGVTRDAVVAVRELSIDGNPSRNWINDHLVYTHGFGFVAAFGNAVDADGKPSFLVGDLPPTDGLGKFEPRIYFGENSPEYSIIGGVKTDSPVEFDYPDDTSASGQKNVTYSGSGGVPIGGLFNKLLFATKYQEQRILLSDLINKDSKILYNRSPRDRVAKVAPWLTLDGDPYPSIVDGKILWIIDGYTTSSQYPYSQSTTLADSTTDALTTNSSSITAQGNQKVNYIRNSVKATVDAYNGTVTLYEWDQKDPILKSWMKAFPGTVKAKSAISKGLMEHLRYPEDLFRVQRDVLSSYHVQTADAFYGGQDFWRVPRDPSTFGANAGAQPPYYLTMELPGAKSPAFSLTTPFVPRGSRENLSAFAVVNSTPGPEYGKMTVLQLPRSTNIAGPSQIASNFEAKPEVANALSLLRQGGSDVVLGNLLTLPVGGGLLYVQPVYVRATSNTAAYPLLQKVLVSFGDVIGFDNSLKGALDQVFGGNSGTSNSGTTTTTTSDSSADLKAALAAAKQAIADGQSALAKGDFAAYGRAQDRLKAAIASAIAAQARMK